MIDLLLDANLSPETSVFLRSTFGLDVVDLISLGPDAVNDEEVAAPAQRRGRIIVTFILTTARSTIAGDSALSASSCCSWKTKPSSRSTEPWNGSFETMSLTRQSGTP